MTIKRPDLARFSPAVEVRGPAEDTGRAAARDVLRACRAAAGADVRLELLALEAATDVLGERAGHLRRRLAGDLEPATAPSA